jgi:hypothetical protein
MAKTFVDFLLERLRAWVYGASSPGDGIDAEEGRSLT